MQSRRHSLLEALFNVAVGYIAAVCSQIVIFHLFDITVPVGTNFIIGAWFTILSLVRSFTLRRLFTRWEDSR